MIQLLLEMLLDIERAIGSGDPLVIRAMVMAAQDCVLQMEREMMESLQGNERLRLTCERLRDEVSDLGRDRQALRRENIRLLTESQALLEKIQTLRREIDEARHAA